MLPDLFWDLLSKQEFISHAVIFRLKRLQTFIIDLCVYTRKSDSARKKHCFFQHICTNLSCKTTKFKLRFIFFVFCIVKKRNSFIEILVLNIKSFPNHHSGAAPPEPNKCKTTVERMKPE